MQYNIFGYVCNYYTFKSSKSKRKFKGVEIFKIACKMFKMQGLVPRVAFVHLLLKEWTEQGTFVPVRPHLIVEHVSKSSTFKTISNLRKMQMEVQEDKQLNLRKETIWNGTKTVGV